MTNTCAYRRAARLIGGLLLLWGACGHVWAADAEVEGLGWEHLCDGQCASCQKPARSSGVPCRRSENACVRAGDPHRISWYAKPSRNKRDSHGYVGGSAVWRGEPRLPDEGTWGLDYAGVFSKNHIWLNWLHGRPARQRGGSYNSDGPHFLSH